MGDHEAAAAAGGFELFFQEVRHLFGGARNRVVVAGRGVNRSKNSSRVISVSSPSSTPILCTKPTGEALVAAISALSPSA